MKTVDEFMQSHTNTYEKASKNGELYLIPILPETCSTNKHLTIKIVTLNVNGKYIEYVRDTVVQTLEGFMRSANPAECASGMCSWDDPPECPRATTTNKCNGNNGGCCTGGGPGPGPGPPPPAGTPKFIMSADLKSYITTNAKKSGTPLETKVTSYLLLLEAGKETDPKDPTYRKMGTLYNLHRFLESSKTNPTLPIDRLVIGFFRPDANYKIIQEKKSFIVTEDGGNVIPGGALGIYDASAGPSAVNNGDGGYKELQAMIKELKTFKGPTGKPLQVYLSMGGWNFNCHPQLYLNSFGEAGDATASAANEWNWKCEPKNAMGVCDGTNPCWLLKRNHILFYDPDAYKAYTGDGDYATADNLTRLAVATAPGVQTKPGPAPALVLLLVLVPSWSYSVCQWGLLVSFEGDNILSDWT